MSAVYDPETDNDEFAKHSKTKVSDATQSSYGKTNRAQAQSKRDAERLDRLRDAETGGDTKTEERAEKKESDELASSMPSFFKDEGKPKLSVSQRARQAFGGNNKKKFIAAGVSGTALLFLIGIVILFVSFLSIPHFAEQITAYNFARSARTFRKSVSQLTSERAWISQLSDEEYQAQKSRFQRVRDKTWGRLDKYRPNQVLRTMRATGRLNFELSEPSRVLGRRAITAVVIDGERVELPKERFGRIFQNRTERVRFSAELDANLGQALKEESGLIRSKVAKSIRNDLGVRLSFWEKKGATFRDLNKAEADRLLARQLRDTIEADPDDPAKVQNLNKAVDETKKVIDDTYGNDQELDTALGTNGDSLSDDVADVATKSFDSTGAQALRWTSTTYAVAEPLCIIYEGSVERSGGTIDARSQSLQTTYYSLATAADQQKSGDTTSAAVGTFQNKLKTTGNSPVEKRARAEPVHQDYVPVGPQAGGIGTYSILNVLLGDETARFTNAIADSACPTLTNYIVSGFVGFGELVSGVFTGGSSTAAANGAKITVREILRELASSFVSRKAVTRFVRNGAATGGLTLISRLLVTSRAGAEYIGLGSGDDFVTQADMGADLHANEVNRQQFRGRPLTQNEISQDYTETLAYLSEKHQSQSTFDRYFNIEKYDSFASTMASSLRNKTATSPSLATINPFSKLSNMANNFNSSSALAAVDQANLYKNVQWGWSADEEALIRNDASYSPLINDEILQASGFADEIEATYGKCYTETMGTLLEEKKIQRDDDGNVNNSGLCSPQNLGVNNADYGDLVFRWRLSGRNQGTLDHLLDLQNPGTGSVAASQLEAGSSIVGDPLETSVDVQCGNGTQDLGVHDGYVGGNLVKHRLCAIPSIPSTGSESTIGSQYYIEGADGKAIVNSRVSGAVQAMGLAAQADGITLSVESSFRTSAHQEYLSSTTSDSGQVARKNTSNHQNGTALDFKTGGYYVRGASCGANRSTSTSDMWKWLDDNADKFGYRQYPAEAWHWDTRAEGKGC